MTRVLIIEPGYCPYQAAFDSPQAAISEVIEGDSLLLKPFGTSKIGVVCSKNQSRLKYNRQLEDGCTIRGRFLVCGLSESKMLGLSKEQAERYNRLLFFPQVEDMLSGDLPVVPKCGYRSLRASFALAGAGRAAFSFPACFAASAICSLIGAGRTAWARATSCSTAA